MQGFTCLCNSIANCVALAIFIGTVRTNWLNDIRARRGNACVRTCKTKTKIEPKLKRQRKLIYQRKTKTKTKMILRTKNTA